MAAPCTDCCGAGTVTVTDGAQTYTITCGACDDSGRTPTLADNEGNGQSSSG